MSARSSLMVAAIVLLVGFEQPPTAALAASDPRGNPLTATMSGIGLRGEPLSDRQLARCVISAPRIHYPRLSRLIRSRGTGLYEMRVDPSTGKVTEVVILKSTGARILDIECMRALGHWI